MSARHDRQSFLGLDSEPQLAASKVAIIGLCGGGSHVAQQLAHVGVGELLLIDFDHVDETNLNRMIGSSPLDAESGRAKADVIGDMVDRIRPGTARRLNGRWQEHLDLLRACTCIVSAVDSLQARHHIEAFARRFMIPVIDVGLDVSAIDGGFAMAGQVVLSIPGGPCMRCLGFLTNATLAEEARRYGDAGGRPQVVWANGVLASTAVGHVVRLITGWEVTDVSPYLEYSGNCGTIEPSNLARHAPATCPHYPLDAVGDHFFTLSGER